LINSKIIALSKIGLNLSFELLAASVGSISKVVKSSKVDLNSKFEFEGVESIPKVVESSKAW
jgi:hypothetical protein